MAKKLSPFEEAFKEARADGKKTFTFNGKSYGTVTADDEQKRIDKKFESMGRTQGEPTEIQAGTRYVNFPHTPTPSNAKARSLMDQGRGVQLYKDVDNEAVLNAGLGLASVFPGTIAARAAYGVARPAIGAAAKYLSKPTGLRIKKPNFSGTKDNPASVADDIKDPSFNPEKMIDSSRSEPAFNLEKMAGRERPEPNFKKGGKVSASSRGDGIAQRGKTKGRMC
jgi:hypothetical protein